MSYWVLFTAISQLTLFIFAVEMIKHCPHVVAMGKSYVMIFKLRSLSENLVAILMGYIFLLFLLIRMELAMFNWISSGNYSCMACISLYNTCHLINLCSVLKFFFNPPIFGMIRRE